MKLYRVSDTIDLDWFVLCEEDFEVKFDEQGGLSSLKSTLPGTNSLCQEIYKHKYIFVCVCVCECT